MNIMDAFEAYKIYMGLKAHFNSKYDFVKYGGKTKANKKSYLNTKDKHFFGRVSRKYGEEVQDFFVSNFLVNEKGYVGEFNDKNFTDWKKKTQSLRYNFIQDIELLLNQVKDFNNVFKVEDGQHPLLFKNYLSKRINIETMVILDKLLNYSTDFSKKISENIVWPNHNNKIKNYISLLTFNETEYKMLLLKMLVEHKNAHSKNL